MRVQKVSDKEFKDAIASNEKVIIKYFAGWCGSCRLFAPKYNKMSDEEEFQDVNFLDIKPDENPEARKWAGVSNLPFFAVVKNGEIVKADYTAKEESVRDMIKSLN